MAYEYILSERLDGVALITLNRPEKLNALSFPLMEELDRALTGYEQDDDIKAVILTGAGERAFVGGADLNELAHFDRDSAREFITLIHRCCDGFRRLAVPVIARIDGFALGAGLELAAACDLRVASDRSMFGMPEILVGVPSVVEAALLPALIGGGRARRLLLTGEMIGAAQALVWGLIDAVAPPDRLDAEVERLAAAILAGGPRAIRLQKALILDWEDMSASAAIAQGIEAFREAYRTDEPRRMATARLAEMRARRSLREPR